MTEQEIVAAIREHLSRVPMPTEPIPALGKTVEMAPWDAVALLSSGHFIIVNRSLLFAAMTYLETRLEEA